MDLTGTETLLSSLAVVAVVTIVITLMVIAHRLRNLGSYRLEGTIDQAVARLGQATQHYVEVNAILALVDQFEERPELMTRLGEYSRQVVAACILQQLNTVSSTIKAVHIKRSTYEKNRASFGGYVTDINRCNEELKRLKGELTALEKAAEQYGTNNLTTVS